MRYDRVAGGFTPLTSPEVPHFKGRIMRIGLWLASCMALFLVSSPAFAAEKFERKYAESSKQVRQAESKVEQTLTIAGMALETKVTSFSVSAAVAGKRDADGKLAVEETINVLQSNLELPGGIKLDFDSANPDKEADIPALNPLLDVFRAILKHPTTTVVDRDNKVQEVTMADNPREKLPKEYQGFLDPKAQKREREQAWLFLPDKDVEAGAEWERFVDQDLGGGQTMNFKVKYAYAGKETKDGKTAHKFTVTHQEVTYAMDPNANPMVQVTKSDLKIAKSSGTILYDPATGEIPSRESTVKITGKMTLVINGQELPGDLDLTLTEKTTLQK